MASFTTNSSIYPVPFTSVLANMALFFTPLALIFIVLTYDIWVRKDRAWWAAAGRNVVAFLGMLGICFALQVCVYYWAVPVLFFIADHQVAIFWWGMTATFTGIWAYIAYDDYKLSGQQGLTNHLWGLFHVACFALFITAFIYQHAQAMAWIALIWGFASFFGLIENLEGQQRREILRRAYIRASFSSCLR